MVTMKRALTAEAQRNIQGEPVFAGFMPFSCMLPELQDQARKMFKELNPVYNLEVSLALRIHPTPAHHHACMR